MAVKTIDYKGKPYVEVKERVHQVYEQKRDFEVVDSVFYQVGERTLCKVSILVDGKRYTGSAEAKLLNAAPKSADATNPLECAETSALGRALAFAGFGSVDSIASFDEMTRGVARDEISNPMYPNEEQVAELKDRCDMLFGSGKWNNVKFKLFGASIPDSKLTPEQMTQLEGKFNHVESVRAAKTEDGAA